MVFQVLVEREALRAELCCARARQASEYYPPRTPIGDAQTLAHCGGHLLPSGGDLLDRLIARRQFPEPIVCSIIKKLRSAILYLYGADRTWLFVSRDFFKCIFGIYPRCILISCVYTHSSA